MVFLWVADLLQKTEHDMELLHAIGMRDGPWLYFVRGPNNFRCS